MQNSNPEPSPPTEQMNLWYHFVRTICRVVFSTIFALKVSGKENIPPAGPLLVLSNHQSHLDPLAIAAASPRRLRALARESLFFWPLSWMIRSLGAIPVGSAGSTRASLKATFKHLDNGTAMLIFPEGTRTDDGEIAELQSGFQMLTRKKNPTILPMAIEGSYQAWPKSRLLPRPGRLAIAFGEPISHEEYGAWDAKEFEPRVTEILNDCLAEARALRS